MDMSRVEPFLTGLPIRDLQTKRLVQFNFNRNQQKIHNLLVERQKQNKLLRLIILKARRIGGSSYTEGLGLCHCISRDGATASVVAHQYKSSQALFETPLTMVKYHIPGSISLLNMFRMPPPTKHRIAFPHDAGESEMTIATAGSLEGGRGMSNSFLHLSEAAFYVGSEAFTALLPTVPRAHGTVVVIESTANGRVGIGEAFYQYWCAAVQGDNEFTPVFIPWFDRVECVADPDLAKDAPIDEDERVLMKVFKVNRAQLAWRRMAIETECGGYLPSFNAEYPSTPEEAFVATGLPAFERDEIRYIRSTMTQPKFRGHFDRRSDQKDDVVFVEGEGDWLIWKEPIFGHHYYAGADAARGEEEGDFAAIVIFDGTTGEQVARFSARIPPERLAKECDLVGRWYNRAMVNIELTGNLGLWAQKVLRDELLYPNIYRWKGRDDRVGVQPKRAAGGFETNVRTRQMMFDALRASIRAQEVKVVDEGLINQMDGATRKDDWTWQVVRGHDDILMAALLGWIECKQWAPPRTLRGWYADGPGEEVDLRYQDDVATSLMRHFASITDYNRRVKQQGRGFRLEGV